MSDIDLITSQVNNMSASLTTWNKIVVFFTAATAIVAALYFVATYITHKKAILLDKAKDELIKAKDEQLERDLKDKDIQIGNIKKEAESLKKDAAKAQTEAANAQLALLEYKERHKDRRLTEQQANHLLVEVKGKSPGDIWLSCKGTDSEACQFAQQIFKVLRAANWNIINGDVMTQEIYSSTGFTEGIVITINKELKSIPVGIDSFHKTMLKFGFASRIQTSTKNSIEIWIGAKPNPE
ncbi:MAG: hypothetical protein AB1306_11495 [Nitrospirota bacterium]